MEKSIRPFSLLVLPKSGLDDPSINALAVKYRAFRLHALQTSPRAFAASLAVEEQLPIAHTIGRLRNEHARQIIACRSVKDSPASSEQPTVGQIVECEWLGMVVLLGPEEELSTTVTARADPFAHMTGEAKSSPDQLQRGDVNAYSSLHFHLNGVFVTSTARGSGVGKALIQYALELARTKAKARSSSFKCSILVDSENEAARRLYEAAGFTIVGQETYVQQPRVLVASEDESAERTALLLSYLSNDT